MRCAQKFELEGLNATNDGNEISQEADNINEEIIYEQKLTVLLYTDTHTHIKP